MTFTVPLFLIAALAAGIPVVLHLINRRNAKELPFPTLRFLRISVRKTRRRRRLEDLLLLLLRMAVLALIALGLARPTITNLAALWGGRGDTAVALVLDNSASMGLIDRERVRFETARLAAGQVLDQLGDGDQVALFLTGGPQFPEQGRLDRTHEKVRQILDQCRFGYQRANLGASVQKARKLLAGADAANKYIYVISDLQKLSWDGFSPSALAGQSAVVPTAAKQPAEHRLAAADIDRLATAGTAAKRSANHRLAAAGTAAPDDHTIAQPGPGREIPVILVDCNRAPRPNVAVTGVTARAPVPLSGVPVVVTAEVLNTSPVDQQRHLELWIDGGKVAASPVLNVPAKGRLKSDFTHTFQRGGLHRGEVRLAGEDGSPLDDRWFFTMEIDREIPVAVIKPQRHEIPYLEETFYLERALEPDRSDGRAIRTTALLPGETAGRPLSDFKVIFCVDLPAPDAELAGRLGNYVAGGGNLLWICGENVDPKAYNYMNQQADGRLLPAELLDIRTAGVAGDRDSWNCTFLDKRHPALGQLVEPASLYQSILVYKHVRLDTSALPGCRILARLDDGEPLLVERDLGPGRVLMLGAGAETDWSNLPLRPIFMPLVMQLTFDLAGAEQSARSVIAGSPLCLPLGDQAGQIAVEVLPPGGETIRLTANDRQGGGREFRYADTHRIGVYLLRLLQAARPRQTAFSVNRDPAEADPAKIPRAQLEELFAGTPLVFADDPDDLSSTFARLREGRSLSGLLLSAVLIVLVFETLLSNRLTTKRK